MLQIRNNNKYLTNQNLILAINFSLIIILCLDKCGAHLLNFVSHNQIIEKFELNVV